MVESDAPHVRVVMLRLGYILTSFRPMEARINALSDRHAATMQGKK